MLLHVTISVIRVQREALDLKALREILDQKEPKDHRYSMHCKKCIVYVCVYITKSFLIVSHTGTKRRHWQSWTCRPSRTSGKLCSLYLVVKIAILFILSPGTTWTSSKTITVCWYV